MKRSIKQTIEWYTKRGELRDPLVGPILSGLQRKHSLTKTEAEDALVEWMEWHDKTVAE